MRVGKGLKTLEFLFNEKYDLQRVFNPHSEREP